MRFLLSIVAATMLSACATNGAQKIPDANLGALKSFYVARHPEDDRGIERLIAARLQKSGMVAASGAEPDPAQPVDAIVTYQDRWAWDLTMYMIRLNIQIRDGHSGSILAAGESMRPSLQRKSPEGMVEEVLTEIFKQ
jgi:hypothetical protein